MNRKKTRINLAILEAIKERKWLHVSYVNKNGENTTFFGGVLDISLQKGLIQIEIFNPYKSLNCLDRAPWIQLDGIMEAATIPQSFFNVPKKLRVDRYEELYNFFDGGVTTDNVLDYLLEAYKNDVDPYLEDTLMVEGIDYVSLTKSPFLQLSDAQFEKLIKGFFLKHNRKYVDEQTKYESAQKEYEHTTLCFNELALDVKGKTYVMVYRNVEIDFKKRTISVSPEPFANKTFNIDFEQGRIAKLSDCIDGDPDAFIDEYRENPAGCVDLVREFANGHSLEVNTRPLIFIVRRPYLDGVSNAIEGIQEQIAEKELTQPLKAFFGQNRSGTGSNKDPFIVIFNKEKTNIDQMRVISNAMVNHMTYVKGPPGTGKTETIFNVILSAYANNKKCLICSNNNHPLDDIYRKMSGSFDFKDGRDIFFPIIRLGNKEVLKDSLLTVKEAFLWAERMSKKRTNERLTERSKKKGLSGDSKLRAMLAVYEKKQDIKERIKKLYDFSNLQMKENLKESILRQIEISKQEYKDAGFIDEDKASSLAVSAEESRKFKDYLYFSSLDHLKKLNSDNFLELRELAFAGEGIEDVALREQTFEEAASDFGKYLKQDENLQRFLNVFPIVVCTNDSANRLGSAKPHFDMCIMDEAGQCNVATSLISIVRCTDLVLVGDTNQLQPVTVLDHHLNSILIDEFMVDHEYDYVKNSILSTMMAKDKNSKTIMLRYHYRCGKKIVGFSNQRFYAGELRPKKEKEGTLAYIDVKNRRSETRNCYKEEAKAVVDVIVKGKYKDVGIITPFRAQAKAINDELISRGIKDVSAGTVHSLQGSEKSTIILSPALSTDTGKKTMDWVKNNKELINVAVTRAKDDLIIVGDKEAIDALSRRAGDTNNDIKSLSDYVYSNGERVVAPSENAIVTNFSNNSKSELEFIKTISPYFDKPGSNFKAERNVLIRDAIKNVSFEEIKSFGKKEFDVVIYGRYGNFKHRPIVVFEVDGGEHVASAKTREKDAKKEEICKRYGLTLIRVSNSQVKDYELIIQLFEGLINKTNHIEFYSQLSLFADENGQVA